jgi:hypothetical protein
VEIIVKVKAIQVSDPAAHVARLVRGTETITAQRIAVEEVFPGLRTGHSAGMVSLVVPDDLPGGDLQRILHALRSDRLVEYAEKPSPRMTR